MDDAQNVYREEARELLAELETSLLELEENPDDRELIGRIFRAMHTIKGSGAMFGFTDIAAFTHEVETIYDLVREGKMAVSAKLVNLSLAARDQIRVMLEAADSGVPAEAAESARIIGELTALRQEASPESAPPVRPAPADPPPPAADGGSAAVYRIRFKPKPDLFRSGTNPLLLLAELQELGECTVIANTERVPNIEAIDPESCFIFWDVTLTTDRGREAIRDIFIFVEDLCELSIEVAASCDMSEEEAHKKRGEILIERGDLSLETLSTQLKSQKRIGEVLVEQQIVSQDAVDAALAEQRHVKELCGKRQKEALSASIRVDALRLDGLVNLVGELVTVQARLSQYSQQSSDPELHTIAEEVERLTGELRDNTMGIRMMPIGGIFSKFRRLVRDLSRDLGKEVAMTTAGEETELDKTVIEKLNDPFVHLIRNSIDHGIEPPEARAAKGKPRQGVVHLSAAHSGDSVLIEIKDDGAGLNREALRRKAIERGLLSEGGVISDPELYQLIFAPGFSTAASVTNVSGRGVGMDVVKRGIDALRGSISLTSEPGTGTTIRIRLPLTLAIIESLLVKIGEDGFVLPLGAVEECIELSRNGAASGQGRDLINVRGHLVPYVSLRERFAIAGQPPAIEQIVITSVNGHKVGLVVDQVVGQHQTVIKTLGPLHREVRGISGATILGDGSVALIIDIGQIIEDASLACLPSAA